MDNLPPRCLPIRVNARAGRIDQPAIADRRHYGPLDDVVDEQFSRDTLGVTSRKGALNQITPRGGNAQ